MRKLVILSGTAGAGKTMTTNILEDLGYCCIDQYPTELLGDLIELIQKDNSAKYEKVVLTVPVCELEKYEALIRNSELKPILILMDASKETIINRYKFTRRIHPLLINNTADTLSEAIDIEKAVVKKYNKRNVHLINTTSISSKGIREKLDKILNNENEEENLSLSFVSFGFKNGVPSDADNIFDVRILDNPYYVEKLKDLTGNDKPVKDFVLKSKKTERYLKKLIAYLDFMLKVYSKEEKRHLTIAIGCTGGQHRSVTVANYLYNYYKDKYVCYIKHRELEK